MTSFQPEFLTALGIRLPDLVSGFAGGVVNALLFQRARPVDAVASVIAGALTANYLAATAAHITGAEIAPTGFIVGLTAMAICQGLFSTVRGWFKRFHDGRELSGP